MSREGNPAMDQRSPAAASVASRKQVSVLKFLREVRGELRRVSWPSRTEVASYSVVVLVAVVLLTTLVFLLDQLFGFVVLRLFA